MHNFNKSTFFCVSQKHLFFWKFILHKVDSWPPRPLLLLRWGNQEKMRFGHKFWRGGPIDLRSMCLNCILQDLFRNTLKPYLLHSNTRPNMAKYAKYGICQIIWGTYSTWMYLFTLLLYRYPTLFTEQQQKGGIGYYCSWMKMTNSLCRTRLRTYKHNLGSKAHQENHE